MPEITPLRRAFGIIIVALFTVLAAIAAALLYYSQVDPLSYQVVFLTNNQQYFGKLHNVESAEPYLTDIYYIQSQNTAQSPAEQAAFQLVKMGKEIHGPQDKLFLNWDNVLFWQNIQADSRVMKVISEMKAQHEQEQPAPQTN